MKNYKLKRKLISIQCDGCGITYDKPITEYNRNIEKGRKSYCSRNCTGKFNHGHLEKYRNLNDISQYSNNRANEYSQFKYYLKGPKARYKECLITVEDLKNQWEKQNGICPYTGIKLILTTHTKVIKDPIYRASLDRIDSSKGYIIDNIQFISLPINYMKNTMSHEQTLDLCKIISKFHNSL